MIRDNSKTVKVSFNEAECLALSPENARKYLITRVFLPLAITVAGQNSAGVHVYMHLSKNSDGWIVPEFTFVHDDSDVSDNSISNSRDSIHPEKLELVFGPQSVRNLLAKACTYAFDECTPTDFSLATTSTKLGSLPLVAVVFGREAQLVLNPVVKTRSRVRHESALLNQATCIDDLRAVEYSKKYGKLYNVLTGEWIKVCGGCSECAAITDKGVLSNAYLDPELS